MSIASNIAEGAGQKSKNEFKQFLSYANGPRNELETQLLVAKDQNYLNEDDFIKCSSKISEIQKMNFKLIKSIN